MESIFLELSIVIAIALILAFLMKLIRQPLIIAYIFSGIVVGPMFLNLVKSQDTLVAFSQMGIAFLLFMLGLNLNLEVLKEVGLVAFITGIGQVLFTSVIGYLIAISFGFSSLSAIYISVALTFSSTIIIVKLLSDKNDLDTLYGRISIGFLIVQDIVAIFILMFLSGYVSGVSIPSLLTTTFLKGIGFILILFIITRYILYRLLHNIAKSKELLFLFAITWCFVISVASSYLGFSIEIGALLAGISLASSPFHYEISRKIRPLRDFFIILFFVALGSQMTFSITSLMVPAIVLSVFVLIGNPLIVMTLIGLFGYKKRTGFLAGLTVAQISEFSLILVALGLKLGHLSPEIVSMVTVIGIITITGSTYMILKGNHLYNSLSKYLGIFERKNTEIEELSYHNKKEKYEVILFGYNRTGYSLVGKLQKMKKKLLVVDFNPDIIKRLAKENIHCKYGDASDTELLDELPLNKAHMVISTIIDTEVNLQLVNKINEINKKVIIIIKANQIDEALELYDAGANYVILPHFLGGEHASLLIEKYRGNIGKFLKVKLNHIEELKKRKEFGHEHPKHERHH